MPCYDGRDDGRASIVEDVRNSTRRESQAEITRLKNRNDKLARMLCGLCNILRIAGQNRDRYPQSYINDVEELAEWWKEHQEFDRKRKVLKKKSSRS